MENDSNVKNIYSTLAKGYAKRFSKRTSHLSEFLRIMPKKSRILKVRCGTGTDAGYQKNI